MLGRMGAIFGRGGDAVERPGGVPSSGGSYAPTYHIYGF